MIKILYQFTVILLILSSTTLFFAETITNPDTPAGVKEKDLVKTAMLKEVLRITDEAGDFTFKKPRRIKIAPDGSIFVAERSQLLKFAKNGTFIKNFFQVGEGPGEVKYFADFAFDSGNVVIGAYMPPKVILKSANGKFINEFRLDTVKPFVQMRHAAENTFYFQDNDISFGNLGKMKSGIHKRNHSLVSCGLDGKLNSPDIKFTTIDAVIKHTSEEGGVAIGMDEITRFIIAFEKHDFVYIVHADRYQIIQMELKTGKILRRFNRTYQPVIYNKNPDLEAEDEELEKIKSIKFFNDIQAMQMYEGKLMVFTSTLNKDRGVLVDVFDSRGKYVDAFYLQVPGVERPDDLVRKPMCFSDGFFYSSFIDEDDNPVVVKYKIEI